MKTKILIVALCAYCSTALGQQLVIDNQGHSGLINDLAFIKGGKYLLSTSTDKTVRIWDVGAGSLNKTYRFEQQIGVNGKIYASALSKDERFLFLGGFFDTPGSDGSSIGEIRVLSLFSDKLIKPVVGHSNVVLDLAISNDGSKLMSSSADNTIKIWDITNLGENSTPELLASIDVQTQLNCIAINSQGTMIAGGDSDGYLRTWNISDVSNITTAKSKIHEEEIRDLAFTNEGTNLFSCGDDGRVVKWTSGGKFMDFFADLPGAVGSIEISNDDRYITAMGRAGIVYDIESKSAMSSFGLHTNSVSATTSAPFTTFDSKSGSYIASAGGDDKNIFIWDLMSGDVARNLVGSGKSVFAVSGSESGNILGFSQNNPTGNLDDVKLERKFDLKELILDRSEVSQRGFTKSKVNGGGKYIAKESSNSFLIGDQEVQTDEYEDGTVRSFTYVQNDEAVVVGSSFSLKKYTTDGRVLGSYKGHEGETWAVSEIVSRGILLSGNSDQTMKLWNVSTGENILTLFVSQDNEWVIWTPQGFYEASAGGEKYIGWHINKGRGKLAEFHDVAAFSHHFHRRDVIERILELKSFKEVAAELSLSLSPKENVIAPEIQWVTPEATTSIVNGNSTIVTFWVKSKYPISQIKLMADGRPIVNQKDVSISGDDRAEEVDITVTIPQGTSGIFSLTLFVTDGKNKITSTEKIVSFVAPDDVEQIVQEFSLEDEVAEEYVEPVSTPAPATPVPVYTSNTGGQDRSRLTLDPVNDDQKPPGQLFMVSIGVSKFVNPEYNLNFAKADADAVADMFDDQKGKMFERVTSIKLVDERATRAKIISTFEKLEKYTSVDDFVVIFMASHGMNIDGKFFFLPHDGNANSPRSSCIAWRDFSDLIGNIPAKVILFIDTCHSGQLGTDIPQKSQDNTEAVREMSSKEYGVVVMAAATGYEYSLEHPDWGHGAFTLSLLEAIGEGKADVKPDGIIYLRELDYYLADRVRELTGGRQHPTTQKPSSISRLQIAKKP
ncbi:MAG: caspase family protein [Reichenbachiella sp.]